MVGVVASGSGDTALAESLANELGWEHCQLEARRFPDTEGYVRVPDNCIESVRSGPVALVSATFPDSAILETLFLLHALDDVRKGNLTSLKDGEKNLPDVGPGLLLIIPYFGYSRQDKRFMIGEAISAQFLASTFSKHCDGIVILDIHAPTAVEDLNTPLELVTSMPEIAQHLQKNVKPDFILSPDKGAVERANEVAEAIGIPFSYLEKKRIDAHTIEHTPKDLDVEGKIVAIVDDMISTGGTICRASEALLKQGAKEVHAACTHGLFTGGAIHRLSNHVNGVHSTDSLPNPRANVSAAPALARGISSLLSRF
jgi:ribose-phosphate pyrophosphokinase